MTSTAPGSNTGGGSVGAGPTCAAVDGPCGTGMFGQPTFYVSPIMIVVNIHVSLFWFIIKFIYLWLTSST